MADEPARRAAAATARGSEREAAGSMMTYRPRSFAARASLSWALRRAWMRGQRRGGAGGQGLVHGAEEQEVFDGLGGQAHVG